MRRTCKVCNKEKDFGSKTTSYTCDSCIAAGFKYCNTCGKILNIERFTIRGTTINGLPTYESTCKDCIREYKRVHQIQYNKTPEGNAKLRTRTANRNRHSKAGDLTATQWQQIVELFEHTCAYCGSVEKLSIEHIVPVSHGGQLTKSNIIVACQHCNSSRGNKDIYKWLDTIALERKEKILWYMNEGYKTIE